MFGRFVGCHCTHSLSILATPGKQGREQCETTFSATNESIAPIALPPQLILQGGWHHETKRIRQAKAPQRKEHIAPWVCRRNRHRGNVTCGRIVGMLVASEFARRSIRNAS